MFTSKVANVGPGEEISVTLTYLQKVAYKQGQFSLRFPMTITPRYIPGTPVIGDSGNGFSAELAREQVLQIDNLSGWSTATDEVPDAADITPFLNPQPASEHHPVNPITVNANIDAGLPLAAVASTYHDVQIERSENSYAVALASGPVSMDRDFELTWRPTASSAPQAAAFTHPPCSADAGHRQAIGAVFKHQ